MRETVSNLHFLAFLGQASLPETCPVCDHTPLSADLCKPNKALRTTLKAFLRSEEKKRSAVATPAPATPAPVTPGDGTPAQQETPVKAVVSDENPVNQLTEASLNANAEATEPTDQPEVAESENVTAEKVGEGDSISHVGPPSQVCRCENGSFASTWLLSSNLIS